MDDLVGGERHVHVAGAPTIGQLRNIGAEAAAGAVIAHFDDDDYSSPGRLRDQIDRLVASGKAVTGYRSMRFTDGREWWLYKGDVEYALGTSLCYLRSWWQANPFPELQVGEDNGMVSRARAQGQMISADAGQLMWATVHPGNTSPRNMANHKQWLKL